MMRARVPSVSNALLLIPTGLTPGISIQTGLTPDTSIQTGLANVKTHMLNRQGCCKVGFPL